MSVYIRAFEKADLDAFEPLENIIGDEKLSLEMAQAIEDSDLSVTGLRDGKVIGCGGVHPLNNGQGELWLRLSKDCLEHKFDTIRWLREGLQIIEETYSFYQLNVAIKENFAESIKLAEFLGFKKTEALTYEDKNWFIFSKRVK